jgi:predicted membrane-bound dolichyl-phosphate-mannose-protein mannosyltransferase
MGTIEMEVHLVTMRTPNFAPWTNIAVGILAIISPFALHVNGAIETSSIIVGIIIAVIAIVELASYARTSNMTYWPVINILAGIWLFISTSLADGNAGIIWSCIALGVITIVTALVALGYERVHETEEHAAVR